MLHTQSGISTVYIERWAYYGLTLELGKPNSLKPDFSYMSCLGHHGTLNDITGRATGFLNFPSRHSEHQDLMHPVNSASQNLSNLSGLGEEALFSGWIISYSNGPWQLPGTLWSVCLKHLGWKEERESIPGTQWAHLPITATTFFWRKTSWCEAWVREVFFLRCFTYDSEQFKGL